MRISDWSSDVCSSDLAWLPCRSPYLLRLSVIDDERLRRNGSHGYAASSPAAPGSQRALFDSSPRLKPHRIFKQKQVSSQGATAPRRQETELPDRKSTRLNSSH